MVFLILRNFTKIHNNLATRKSTLSKNFCRKLLKIKNFFGGPEVCELRRHIIRNTLLSLKKINGQKGKQIL